MHSPKAFLAQLPELCCKAWTGLEDGESALGRAASKGLAGLKSLLPLVRTRKQTLTRAAVLLASHGGRGPARGESKGSLPYKILENPPSKKLPAAVLSFSTPVILPSMFFQTIYEYSQNSVLQEYREMGKGGTFYCIYKYFIQVASKCIVALQWCLLERAAAGTQPGRCWRRTIGTSGEGLGKASSSKKADGGTLPSKAPPSDHPLWQSPF